MGLTCDLRWCNSASRVTLISLSIYLSLLSVIAKPPTQKKHFIANKIYYKFVVIRALLFPFISVFHSETIAD